jgi:hypothetical protein
LALFLLSSLAVVNVGMVKPEIAGAADESVDAAGAEPKPPNENPLLAEAVAGAAAEGAAPPKENPPVVTAALDVPVAKAADALKVNPPVDTAPTPVDVDDAGAAPPNEKPPAPMAPAVVVVVVAVVTVPPPAPPPPPPSRRTSQDAHLFNSLLLNELHVMHFHLFFINLAFKSPNPCFGPV